jgi:hypothetical protein
MHTFTRSLMMNSKFPSLGIVLCLLPACAPVGGSGPEPRPSAPSSMQTASVPTPLFDAAALQQSVSAIDQSVPHLKRVQRNVLGETTEGGEATGFLDDKGHVHKIHSTLYSETKRSTLDLYFVDSTRLAFARVITDSYDVPINEPGSKVARTATAEWMFRDETVFQIVKDGVADRTDAPAATKEGVALVALAHRIAATMVDASNPTATP